MILGYNSSLTVYNSIRTIAVRKIHIKRLYVIPFACHSVVTLLIHRVSYYSLVDNEMKTNAIVVYRLLRSCTVQSL